MERFFRLDTSRHLPGNGLGLSIVAAIAQLHGGALHLEDAVPGLRARIELPKGEAIAEPEPGLGERLRLGTAA